MSYILLGSLRSPFVRIPRLFMTAYRIPFRFEIVNYLEVEKDRERLAAESPINKIPILIDETGQKIFDSRVIINHLTKVRGITPLSLTEENYVSAVYAALDVSVNLFMLKFGGLDLDGTKNWYIDRQKERITKSLDYLTPWAETLDSAKPEHWNYASMSLYSYLFWANARGMLTLANYPALAKFVERFDSATGVRETDFTKA